MIEAVIFDFDGVIVESVDIKTDAFAKLYAPHGPKVVSKVVAHHRAHGGVSRFEKIRFYHEEFLNCAISPVEVERLAEEFSCLVEDLVVTAPWVEGAQEFFAKNSKRPIPFYVASGTPQAELERIIYRRGLAPCFKKVFGSPRSKQDILLEIITYGYNKKNLIMVGDANTDFEAAQMHGVPFIGRVPLGQTSPFPRDTVVCESPYRHLVEMMKP